MQSISHLLLLLIFLKTSVVWGARKTEWSLHLDSKLEAVLFPQAYGTDTNKELYKLELAPIYRWKYLDSWRLHLNPVFIANPNNTSSEEQSFFDPAESYLRFQTSAFSIQAGYQLFTWGITDGYNPLDVVNSKQYFDPLHSRKRGALSLSLSQAFNQWDYDLIYIPRHSGAQLPGAESRWLPREIMVPQTEDNDLVLKLPENLRYQYSDRKSFGTPLDHNVAFRIQRRGTWLDFSLSAYEGVSSFPFIQPVVTGTIIEVSPKTVIQVDPDVGLNTYDYRIRQGGLAITINKWNFLTKLVSSYTQTLEDNVNLQKWSHENVLGLEKTFNFGSDGMLIAILQYSYINTEKQNDSNMSVSEIFRRALMAGGRLSWSEVWNMNIMGLYDTVHGSHFQEYSLSRRLFDAWTLTATVDLIQGSSDTALGVYGKNDSYSLSVSRSF